MTAPVGQSASTSGYQQTARAEVVTNECCELTFEKDLLGSMMGEYSGEERAAGAYDEDEDYADVSRPASKGAKKRKAKGGDSDDDSGDFDDGDDDRRGGNGKGATKRPKISTITNKTRKVAGKGASKKGGKKALSKPKKKG